MVREFIEAILSGALYEQNKLRIYGGHFSVSRKARETLPSWRTRIADRMRRPMGDWWFGSDNLPALEDQ